MSIKMKHKMPRSTAGMWELIDEIGWGTRTTDYNTVAKTLYDAFTETGVNKLRCFVNERVRDLYDKIGLFEKTTGVDLDICSDDGLSDLLYHTVGLGKASFDRRMSNPKQLEEDYKKIMYTESFAYCFQKPEPVLPSTPPVDCITPKRPSRTGHILPVMCVGTMPIPR
jgi:hypothetical protein